MAFGQHLGADQDATLATVCSFQFIFQTAFDASGIAIDAADLGGGESFLQILFDTFGAGTDGKYFGIAALVTIFRCGSL
jgi:hypothetical protein